MDQLIIVAGGSGQRMGGAVPKQFSLLAGKPILLWTLEAFHASGILDNIVVVLPEDHITTWQEVISSYNVNIPHKVVKGGAERTHSVINGLDALPTEGIVGIHDGVRPLVSKDLIVRCYSQAAIHNSAIPVLPIKASLRKRVNSGNHAVDRNEYVEVQTPQCFSTPMLKAAYSKIGSAVLTDDATVFENAGPGIHLVEGEERNLKITTPTDLKIATALLNVE